jgi:TolB-like protein
MSGDASQEYFSDGITEELLNSLSRFNELQVVARTSSYSFKGQNVDVATIAHKLNVGSILEGSVRRAGNTVRITVQLINAVNGFHVWSQTYDRNLSDILRVQTDVATSVAQELQVKLIGDEKAKIQLGGTQNPEAYDEYLRGIGLRRMVVANESAAFAAFDRAIAIDPNYAAAYVERSAVLLDMVIGASNLEVRRHSKEQAMTAAQHAVSLAADLGDAHAVLAAVLYFSLDFYGAAREFDRALALAPGSFTVQASFARFAAILGHLTQRSRQRSGR